LCEGARSRSATPPRVEFPTLKEAGADALAGPASGRPVRRQAVENRKQFRGSAPNLVHL
jgi:hypothetical protein